jgi:hypothetical protein
MPISVPTANSLAGDYLFLIDANRGAAIYQYKIVEK